MHLLAGKAGMDHGNRPDRAGMDFKELNLYGVCSIPKRCKEAIDIFLKFNYIPIYSMDEEEKAKEILFLKRVEGKLFKQHF